MAFLFWLYNQKFQCVRDTGVTFQCYDEICYSGSLNLSVSHDSSDYGHFCYFIYHYQKLIILVSIFINSGYAFIIMLMSSIFWIYLESWDCFCYHNFIFLIHFFRFLQSRTEITQHQNWPLYSLKVVNKSVASDTLIESTIICLDHLEQLKSIYNFYLDDWSNYWQSFFINSNLVVIFKNFSIEHF